jgi:PAS domain S-box-containing protein
VSVWILLSILALLLALVWSLVLVARVRDWRLVFLPLTMAALGASRILPVAANEWSGGLRNGSDLIAFGTSVLALLTVAFLGAVLVRQGRSTDSPEEGSLLGRLIDASPTVIYSARPSGDYGPTYVSANVTTLLGYEARQFIKDPGFWAAHVHPDDAPRVCAERPRLFDEEHRAQQYRFLHRDGTYRWIHDDLRLMRDSEGRPELLVGSWIDITDSKELEAKYLQAQKGAEVERLAGGIAHDFNNLLNVIIGFSGLARDKLSTDDPLRRDLDLISDAGAKASDLTRQLLTFSRQQVLKPKVLDLNALITEFEVLVRRTIEETIEIHLALPSDLGGVRADSGHVEQVLMNLVVNARDAMPRGGRLTIETSNVVLDEAYAQAHMPARPGEYVLLAVTDTGEGMDEATRRRVFEPFFTTKGQGAGLGLSTAYGIVKQSGGYIWVYSEPGLGSTFKVYLPRVGEAAEPSAPEEPAAVRGGSETILVIEDEEAVREFAVRVLEDRGYRVLKARDPQEARRVCQAHAGAVDLLVTDLVMPGGTGTELAKQLEDMKPGAKTLYISGYAERAAIHHGRLAANADFLGKPFRAAALTRKVREILDRAPA